MELRQLRHFVKILEAGSITRASQELNLTQPSLSLSIKALERSVGQQLLNRSRAGITATASGAVFERYARTIIREAEKALSELEGMRGGGLSRITLGVMTAYTIEFVPHVLNRFLNQIDSVDLEMHSFAGGPEGAMQKLQSADWDIALTLVPDGAALPSNIEIQKIGRSASRVYCRASHPIAKQKNVSLADLADCSWAFTNVGEAEAAVAEAFESIDRLPNVKVRTNSLSQIFSSALTHPLLFLAPDLAISSRLAAGDFVAVDQQFLSSASSMAILYSNLAERTTSMRQFVTICSEHAKEISTKTQDGA